MKLNDFVHKYKLKNKTTSKTKNQQVLSSLKLNDIQIYLGDGFLRTDIGIVYIYPSKGTQWVVYINEIYFDSYDCSPPQKLTKIIMERNGHCFYSEHKKQGLTSRRDFIVQVIVF